MIPTYYSVGGISQNIPTTYGNIDLKKEVMIDSIGNSKLKETLHHFEPWAYLWFYEIRVYTNILD